MQVYIERSIAGQVRRRLEQVPAVALLGPRQCGKSTLAKRLIGDRSDTLYLDLEKPSDLNKLRDPEAFFALNRGKLVCLDEIQRVPELFAPLRSIIDEEGRNGQVLILGSASRELIRQSSESLAGRLGYLELTPFLPGETGSGNLRTLWLRGGYPRSYLAADTAASFEWRQDFIRTFLERDIPQLGFTIPARSLERLWRMCAHGHGQLLNASKIGSALGVSHHTVRSYMEIMAATFVLRLLPPFEANLKKRLVKSPKVYIRDSGILHALLDIDSQNDLLGHPVYGASWEGLVVESLIAATPGWQHSFYRTATGVELDLVLRKGPRTVAVECKAAGAPAPTRGLRQALKDLGISEAYLVAPVGDSYPIEEGIQVVSIGEVITRLQPA